MLTRIILGTLFIVFAAVQYNDPDPWLWIIAYAIVGALCLLDVKKLVPKKGIIIATVLYAVATVWYLPLMIDWVNDGMPSIVEEMKAATPHIEWMREFLGLALCTLTLFWLSKSKFHKA